MLTDTSDIFFTNAIKVCAAAALAVAVLNWNSNPDYGKPVKLYRAKPVAESCWQDDWVCLLEKEMLAKAEARPTKGRGHGYSEYERNEMNQLIARLP